MKKRNWREPVDYVIFGVSAAIINYVIFWLFYDLLFGQDHSLTANLVAFAISVVYAFVTNKLFVFKSKSWAAPVIRREIPEFFLARVITFLIEEVGLYLADGVFNLGRYVILSTATVTIDGVVLTKVLLMIVTISLNYLFNILIFKKKK